MGSGGLSGVPNLLANCGFDVNRYRRQLLVSNATVLRDDEWKEIDSMVVQICRSRMTIVNDLVAAGLYVPLTNGMGTTVYEYEDMSDMSAAQMSMAAEAADQEDRVQFAQKYLPLPIVHKGFSVNARALAASRKNNTPLDTTQAQIAATKVSEYIESMFAVGVSSYTYGGGTIYGLKDFSGAQSQTVTAHWNDSGADPLADVIAAKAKMIAAKHFGPWMVYIPTAWEEVLDDDFKANSDKSMYARLKEVQGIIDVKACDSMTADYYVMVEFQPTTIRAIIGQQPTTLEWTTQGGLVSHFKVLSICVPQIRTDQAGNSGVVVGTK
jgi:uncharacterized linocin/CFP29 family protein